MKRQYEHNMLFRPGPNPELNAAVGDNGGPYTFRAYADGFFQAAKYIVDGERAEPMHADLIIYLLAFNYRHGIELYLKSLILHSSAALNTPLKFKKSHSLVDNWKAFVEVSGQLDQAIFEPDLEMGIFKDILDDFIQIDPSGQAFRYPEDRVGNRHLVKQSHINIEVFSQGMDLIHDFLAKWSERISTRYEVNAL